MKINTIFTDMAGAFQTSLNDWENFRPHYSGNGQVEMGAAVKTGAG